MAQGYAIKKTRLTPEFDHAAYLSTHNGGAISLVLVTETSEALPFTPDTPPPRPGQTVISFAPPATT